MDETQTDDLELYDASDAETLLSFESSEVTAAPGIVLNADSIANETIYLSDGGEIIGDVEGGRLVDWLRKHAKS